MLFRIGQVLELPELSAELRLDDPHFVVEAVVRGGMGECLKIVHRTSQQYALKVIKAVALTEREAYARFLQEITLWCTTSACDGVVQAYRVVRINEIPCVCAEWMEGGNLRAQLAIKDPAFFYATMDRILGTLEWVYENHKIIHRDLKPENILLDKEGRAFVSDWGIGKVQIEYTLTLNRESKRSHSLPSTFTQTGQFVGTVPYSAPEQLLGSRSVDHRADMYSLGCLMYEWETGRPPFLGRTAEEIAYQHLESPIPKLGGVFRRTHFGADSLITRCLNKKPEDRFQSYSDFRSFLLSRAGSRAVSVTPYRPRERYSIPLIGAERIRGGFSDAVMGANRQHLDVDGAAVERFAAVPFSEVEPYLREAGILCEVGDWKKASEIYARLFIPEMCSITPGPATASADRN